MNFRIAAVFAIILILLVLGWGFLLRYWQRTLDGPELRARQARGRKRSAVVVFVILVGTIIYWRLLAANLLAPGPSSVLIPLAAIVCLIGVVAVRGLWYFTRPDGKLPWLNTVAYRVPLQAGIIAIVSLLTLWDFRNLPAAVAFSAESNQLAANVFLVFAFLVTILGIGEFFLQRILPNSEDMQDLITTIDERTNKAVEALKGASQILAELESNLQDRKGKLNTLRQEVDEYSILSKVEDEKAKAVIHRLEQLMKKDKAAERWISLLINLAAGSILFVLGLLLSSYFKKLLGIE
jgi:hypothetical protein